MENQTKTCPYCGEEILATARKCKHCGEWLESDTRPQETSGQATPAPQQAPSTAPKQTEDDAQTPGVFEFFLDMTWRGKDIEHPNWTAHASVIPAFHFNATISRRQFWLASLLIAASYGYLSLSLLDLACAVSTSKFVHAIFWIFWAIVTLKSVELQVRRLRDTGKSPWLVLLNLVPIIGWIILIVFFCQKGSQCPRTKWKSRDTIGIILLLFIYAVFELIIPSVLF